MRSSGFSTPSTSWSLLTGASVNGATVEVRVGDEKSFHVHQSVLQSSRFFQNALKPEWRTEGEEKPVELLDVHPSTFEVYIQWLYSGNLAASPPNDSETTRDLFRYLAQAHLLGLRLMDDRFQNATMDAIVSRMGSGTFPGHNTVQLLYDDTNEGSPIRRLMTDVHVFAASASWVENKDFSSYHPDFINDVIKGLIVGRKLPERSQRPWELTPLLYHTKEGPKEGPSTDEKGKDDL